MILNRISFESCLHFYYRKQRSYLRQIPVIPRALCFTRLETALHCLIEIPKLVLAIFLLIYVFQKRQCHSTTEIASSNTMTTRRLSPRLPPRLSLNLGTKIIQSNHPVLFEARPIPKPREPRIFCLCSTTAPRHEDRAIYVRETWGRRCDKLLFASDVDDQYLPSKAFYNQTGRDFVSFKMFSAWKWVYDNYINEFDWFLKADDDTFIVVENVRHFLKDFNPVKAFYFGHPLSSNSSKFHRHYVSGSAQIFSRKTLSRLIREAYPANETLCPGPQLYANEDALVGYCLHNIGIDSYETRDAQNRNRFLIFSPWIHLLIGAFPRDEWIWSYDKTYVEGETCCSSEAISLHYMPDGKMLTVEYLLYRLRPFGVGNSLILRP